MEYDKNWKKMYSLDVARLPLGKSKESYLLDNTFFEQFEKSQVREGQVNVLLDMDKTQGHLKIDFHLQGEVSLNCDRCGQAYPHAIDHRFPILYSFKEDNQEEEEDIIFIERDEHELNLVQEFYDFIHLALPMRKVPKSSVHLCDPKILDLLGLDENGNPKENEEAQEDEEIDPRWAALKKLKDKLD